MFYTIYKISNQINGKIYIGSHKTRNLDDRYMGSGKYLKRAIDKHGVESFKKEILFVFDNPKEMYAKEAELVNEDFLAEENTYNLKVGGFGGFDYLNSVEFVNPTHSTEHAIKMRQNVSDKSIRSNLEKAWLARKIKHQQHGGVWYTPAKSFLGRPHTSETKKKMSDAKKGKCLGEHNSQYGSRWITDGVDNKKIPKNAEIPPMWRLGRV